MSMTTVYVDATNPKRRREIGRDARDPFDDARAIESLADAYSRTGKIVQVYPAGQYVKPWRQNGEPLYESSYGKETTP